jgi:hypothetical protein
VLYWKRKRLTQKRSQFSIDDLSRAEVLERPSFYRSLGGRRQFRFALQHKTHRRQSQNNHWRTF